MSATVPPLSPDAAKVVAGALDAASSSLQPIAEVGGDEASMPSQAEVGYPFLSSIAMRYEPRVSPKGSLKRKPTLGLSGLSDVNKRDSMRYSAFHLTSWGGSLLQVEGTILESPVLWQTLAFSLLVSLGVSFLTLAVSSNPAALQVAKFQKLGTFLTIFMGMCLGFFLSSSINRWYQCADGFLQLFDAVRNMQMQFFALGVPEESERLCIRYGLLSAWLLSIEMHIASLEADKVEAAVDEMWTHMKSTRACLTEDHEDALLRSLFLESGGEPSCLVWTWVASKVGSMAQAGEIPPFESPTYGRVLNLVQAAHGSIRVVRAAATVQAPYVYVHTLSALVHINNIVNAIAFGMSSGVTMGTYLQAETWLHLYGKKAISADVYVDVQNLSISFVLSIFGPFIYHALLLVAMHIAQPLSEDSRFRLFPTERMLENLEQDLWHSKVFSESNHRWTKPNFQRQKVIKK